MRAEARPRRQQRSNLRRRDDFGSNPGNLRMLSYVPQGLPKGRPLVIALHGCTQTAAVYDYGSGWSNLADRHGFAVLFPEQQRANNPNNCFNWFLASDTRRDQGEALSIRQMIECLIQDYGVDRSRIFVVGLSAGGAMAAAMLAAYPDVFAGGAIIAGLPHGAATNVQEAFEAMAGRENPFRRAMGRSRARSIAAQRTMAAVVRVARQRRCDRESAEHGEHSGAVDQSASVVSSSRAWSMRFTATSGVPGVRTTTST